MYFGTDKGDRLTKVTEYSFLINASFSEVDHSLRCKKKKVQNHLFVGQRTNDEQFFKNSENGEMLQPRNSRLDSHVQYI